jgi:hypothetical protein
MAGVIGLAGRNINDSNKCLLIGLVFLMNVRIVIGGPDE